MVRSDVHVQVGVGALRGSENGDEGAGGDEEGGGGGLFRFEKSHYRVLEALALPGAEDAPVR